MPSAASASSARSSTSSASATTLVARNHRTRFGELDLVVRDERALVFGEVKTRARVSGPAPSGTRSTSASAGRSGGWPRAYLHEAPARPPPPSIRFDAIGVVIDARGRLVRLEHLEAAF